MELKWNIRDLSRLEIARKLWNGRARPVLMELWSRDDHPGRERFLENKAIIIGLLESADPVEYARKHEAAGYTLRTMIREIPVIFPKDFKKARINSGLGMDHEM